MGRRTVLRQNYALISEFYGFGQSLKEKLGVRKTLSDLIPLSILSNN